MAASAVMQGWELSALFLLFLFITLFWDFLVGLLTFLNNILRGRKANWLARVKDELLALGVVSLVLLFVEPSLQHICMPGKSKTSSKYSPSYAASSPPEYGTYDCAAGYRQVFPRTVIHAAHYLLFYLAIVHILFSLLTSVITNVKLAKWSALERTARKEQNIPAVAFLRISSVIARAGDPANNRPSMRIRETWRDAIGYVDQDLYSLLRFMCEKRFRAHSVVLRNFNFLNMCEQCLEAELNEVYSHAWLLVFMMSLLLLYNKILYQMAWLSFLCVAMMALMAGNMRWVMKKTAREARNLWRKVQGMGGLEGDDAPAVQVPAAPTAAPPVGWLSGGLGLVNGLIHPWATAAAAAEQKHQQQALAAAAAAAVAAGGGDGAGGGADLEAGDVEALQRMDQLHMDKHSLQLDRLSLKRPHKQLRFASFPRTGPGMPGPVGESREARQGPGAEPDPAAAGPVVAGAGPLGGGRCSGRGGAAGLDGSGCGAVRQRCTGWNPGAVGRSARRRGLVDLLEACREVRAAASLAVVPKSGGGLHGHRQCSRTSGTTQSWQGQPPGGFQGQGGAGMHRGGSWWEPCVYDTAGGVPTGTSSWIVPRQPRCAAGRPSGDASSAAGAAVVCSSSEPSGTGCRKRPVGRSPYMRQGAGPVGEGTISNPLYGVNEGGGGASGGLGVGFNSQLSQHSAHLYGVGLGQGASAIPGMGIGLYVTQTSGGLGSTQGLMHQYSGVTPYTTAVLGERSSTSAALPPPNGVGAVNVIAVAAASPYGGSGNGLVPIAAATVAAPALPAPAAPPTAAAAAADNGQWGSNPSSGSPEEGDDSGSTGSGSSSTGSSAGVEHRQAHAQSKGRGGGHGSTHGGGDEDDEDVHSEKSILEHELASGIEEKITRLFFFGRPFLLLWLFNIIFAQASLTMTMSMAFVIPYNKFDYIRDVAMPTYIWLPVVLTNLMLVFYGCWVFLPQYALLSVCGILEPHEVMDEIKRSKTADKVEEGISGIVLEKMTDYFIGRHDGETRLSTAFIVTLASQAGIILGRDYKAQRFINRAALKPMYKEFVMIWHDIAWYGELSSPYMVKTDVPDFKEAFDELDEDGSGALSFGELANMIRSLGTYATAGDVEAMLWEIDIDNSHSIGFDEFVKFLVYAFFDDKQLSYIDSAALIDAMERLGMPINEMQASVLMTVSHCEPGEEVKVTIRQFFGMFEKVVFAEVEALKEVQAASEGATAASRRASFLVRARELLSSPSSMCLGGQHYNDMQNQDSTALSCYQSGVSGYSAANPDGGAGGGGSAWPVEPWGTIVAASGRAAGSAGGGGGGAGGAGGPDAGRGRQPSRLAVVTKP